MAGETSSRLATRRSSPMSGCRLSADIGPVVGHRLRPRLLRYSFKVLRTSSAWPQERRDLRRALAASSSSDAYHSSSRLS
jgi:hypothetical protein